MGIPYADVYTELKVSKITFWQWVKDKPGLKEVLDLAEKEKKDGESLKNWVYSRLSPELMKVWERIGELEMLSDGISKIELMLEEGGKRMRQQLFLHALCFHNFCVSQALAKVNITKRELDRWIAHDHDFAELVEQIQWHKGNLFEGSLVQLVREGNPAAVLFANKTYNAERGYAQKSKLDINVSGSVTHGVLDLAEIMKLVDEDTRLKVLDAVRKLNTVVPPPKQLSVAERLSQEIADVGTETEK